MTTNRRSANHPIQSIVLVVFAAVLGGAATFLIKTISPSWGVIPLTKSGAPGASGAAINASGSGYPLSMADFVEASEAIISGTVTSRTFLGLTTHPYSGTNGELEIDVPNEAAILATPYIEITAETQDGLETLRMRPEMQNWIPFSSYTINVDHIYKNDGSLDVNDEITLHQTGTIETGYHMAEMPPMDVDDQFLFALVKSPDGVNYEYSYLGAGRLSLDGPVLSGPGSVLETWNDPLVVRFTSNTTAAAFLQELEAAID